MMTRLKCAQGHAWESGGNAPLVCPTCGGAALARSMAGEFESTIDDADRTVDLPTPAPGLSGGAKGPDPEATAVHEFSPIPKTPVTAAGGRAETPNRRSSDAAKASAGMPFTIVRQHARGGLGLVSLARDDQIKREVALKQILPQHGDNGTLNKRFLYEAQITGQLEHPSIVPVYCLGSDGEGRPYYVMRFVKGRTLDEIIREHHDSPNPIVFRELLRRFIAVCQAVAYAHSRGVIHRDLKPANVMLGDYGETLVLDWGLAKDIKNKTDPVSFNESSGVRAGSTSMAAAGGNSIVAGRSASMISMGTPGAATNAELTMEGQIIGTPAYMAPEQAEGKTELHGPVTDIYALGGILYKILTGQSPAAPTQSFTGTGGMRRFVFVPSPSASSLNKDVHPELDRMCARAMATEPAGRYQRALELAQDVQRWLDEHPLVMGRKSGLGETVRKHAILIVGLMGAAIAVLAAMLMMRGR